MTAIAPPSAGRLSPALPFAARESMHDEAFATLRRDMILHCCKWDPQVGDISTIAPFPLVLSTGTWQVLSKWAQALSAELTDAEDELRHRTDLHSRLAIPRRIRSALRSPAATIPTAARISRFDFHFTTDGWRISEVNSDVPGGFTEASELSARMAAYYGLPTTGNPAGAYAAALDRCPPGVIALMAAPGYMEDQQIIAYLMRRLHGVGREAVCITPAQLAWEGGHAVCPVNGAMLNPAAVVRFYQSEWLAHRRSIRGWQSFFRGGTTPVSNPACSILTESKRFPLVWESLKTPLPTWRRLLPFTVHPGEAAWSKQDGWVLKRAFGNTGDEVGTADWLASKPWKSICRSARWHPGEWIAQRRFETLPMDTPLGRMFPCIGVYTVDGKATGCYGRISAKPIVDFEAIDVAILTQHEGG